MPSGFDAIQLAPQSTDDVAIVATQYSGTTADIMKVYDSGGSNLVVEVDANGNYYGGPSFQMTNVAGGTIVTLLAQDPAQPASSTAQSILSPYSGRILVAGSTASPAASGLICKVNATNQSADIASTKLTNATVAGMYHVWAVLEDTTADVTAGIVTLSIAYTDDAGATTNTATTQTLGATGRATLSLPLYLASGDITYSTSHTGIFGSAKYALRIRAALLG
jgi:hypothetical protein